MDLNVGFPVGRDLSRSVPTSPIICLTGGEGSPGVEVHPDGTDCLTQTSRGRPEVTQNGRPESH